MSSTVTGSDVVESAPTASPAAGAVSPEGVTTHGKTVEVISLDDNTAAAYGDGVKRGDSHFDGLSGGRKTALHTAPPPAESAEEREAKRQARLRLWQAIR
jgi:hypothetical protein